MAYIAYADGRREEINPKDVTLEKAQEVVGGYVEPVWPRFQGEYMFLCDEDGKQRGKPVNVHGCELYGPTSPIVGDIIVMRRSEARKWR